MLMPENRKGWISQTKRQILSFFALSYLVSFLWDRRCPWIVTKCRDWNANISRNTPKTLQNKMLGAIGILFSTAKLTHTMNIGTRLRMQIVFGEEYRSNHNTTFKQTLQLTQQVRSTVPHLSLSFKAPSYPHPFQAWVSACVQ